MKYLIISTILLVLLGCQNNHSTEKKVNLFCYESNDEDVKRDTFTIENIWQPYSKDSIVFKYNFTFNNLTHTIKMFSSFKSDPCGPGRLSYQLDTLGLIYEQYSCFSRKYKLKSNNDSINRIINVAVKNIKTHPKLKSFNPFNVEPPPLIFSDSVTQCVKFSNSD